MDLRLDIINSGIKFIGITGPCGSGKSTAAKAIHAYFPNSIILSGAYYHYKATVENKELARSVFGRTFDSVPEVFEHYFQNTSVEGLFKRWNTLAGPHVSEMFMQDIRSLLNQNSTPNPIIGDYFLLNTLAGVWNLTTHKITIEAPLEQIVNNQVGRKVVDEVSLQHDVLLEGLYVGRPGVIIKNTGNLSEFENKVKKYCEIIGTDSSKIF